ncbi:MAG TPA: FecR domain-containing protein [Burkholderiales bacterium]|nr:FecR domain-containing protein [Burkholderiales bacterium]
MSRAFVFVYAPLLFALTLTAALAADIGRVKNVAGPVHIERGAQRIAVRVDTVVQANDTVVTGEDASVGVTFADDTRVSAGPNSTLVMNRYAFDPTTHAGVMDATLRRGTLGVVSGRLAKRSADAVTVRTPTLILGVRGTEFLVAAE